MVRDDNLPAAITACINGGWTIYTGKNSLNYLYQQTGVNIAQLLNTFGSKYYL